MSVIKEDFVRNKKWLYYSFVFVFVWGLAAHAYGFMHSNFSHDSLSEFYGAYGSNLWKIQLGRFAVPVYKALFRTDMTLPWLVGLLGMCWLGLSVYLIVRIFEIKSKVVCFLTAGIFATNITVAATAATFLHDFDCNMFALMCSLVAVFLWRKVRGWETLGALFIAVSLAIYQSYISVTIVAVMLVCILDILNKDSFKKVFLQGLKAIGIIVLGGLIYFFAMHLVANVMDTSLATGKYNTLDKALELTPRRILSLIYYAYRDCYSRLVNVPAPYPQGLVYAATCVLFALTGVRLIQRIRNSHLGWMEIGLLACLIALLPLGMNVTYVLTTGMNHELMVYAVWLSYLLVLLVFEWPDKKTTAAKPEKKRCEFSGNICVMLIAVILYGNVQVGNAMYLKKDLEQKASLSFWSRIVSRIESYDGYEPGTTPVVFAGTTDQLNETIPGFAYYQSINGMGESAVVGTTEDYRVRSYFQYILNNPAYIPEGDVWNPIQTDARVKQMPCYPESGGVQMIDGVLVVKLGEE